MNALAERLLEAAKLGNMKPYADGTDLARFRETADRIKQAGFDPFARPSAFDPGGFREDYAGALLDSYPLDPATGREAVPPRDATFIKALYRGIGDRPAPTLKDAAKLYIAEKANKDSKKHRSKRQRVHRVVGVATKALGADRKITDIRRPDARKVRELFLDTWSSPSTARRYFNDLRGIVSVAILEHELGISNPFSQLPIEVPGSRKDDRDGFTDEQVRSVRARLKEHARPELQNIWTILEYTGCRLSEATGLRKDDVHLQSVDVPYIVFDYNEVRPLKTTASIRQLPLVPSRLFNAVQDACERSRSSPYLFPSYAKERGGDYASAALMRHIRRVTPDSRLTTMSLRHRLKDKLERAGVSFEVREQIIGHAGNAVRHSYGGREAALIVMRDALLKAFPED